MKTIVLTLGFLMVSMSNFAQEVTGSTIEVSIDNVTSDAGQVMVSLHTADTFMKGPGIQNLESKIENGKVSFTFQNVPDGVYAIMALHDVNENRRMDFDNNGMPTESYGMSKNDMSFGPPNFEAAKFTVKEENLTFNIRF